VSILLPSIFPSLPSDYGRRHHPLCFSTMSFDPLVFYPPFPPVIFCELLSLCFFPFAGLPNRFEIFLSVPTPTVLDIFFFLLIPLLYYGFIQRPHANPPHIFFSSSLFHVTPIVFSPPFVFFLYDPLSVTLALFTSPPGFDSGYHRSC